MKISKQLFLQDFFHVPPHPLKNEAEINYHGSLTPPWDLMSTFDQLRMTVGFELPNALSYPSKIEPNNSVNTHMYKPLFFATENVLDIHVASRDVLFHTLRSYAKVRAHLKLASTLPVSVHFSQKSYGSFISSWKVHDHLMIGRCASIESFIRCIWLFEHHFLSKSEFHSLLEEIELSRIQEVSIEKYSFLFKKADSALQIKHQHSDSYVLDSFNFKWKDRAITVLQLPWGVYMTKQMLQAIFQKQKHLKKIGLIGGVGYTGTHSPVPSVDDIFIPDTMISTDPIGQYFKDSFKNEALEIGPNILFPNKRVLTGSIFSIIPKRGVISNSAVLKESNLEVDAVDMEALAFYDFFCSSATSISFASLYYIMDMPYQGLDLGNTYYDKTFLHRLFHSQNRGKYFCMEKILTFLSEAE